MSLLQGSEMNMVGPPWPFTRIFVFERPRAGKDPAYRWGGKARPKKPMMGKGGKSEERLWAIGRQTRRRPLDWGAC